jgi:hypothetical protein
MCICESSHKLQVYKWCLFLDLIEASRAMRVFPQRSGEKGDIHYRFSHRMWKSCFTRVFEQSLQVRRVFDFILIHMEKRDCAAENLYGTNTLSCFESISQKVGEFA